MLLRNRTGEEGIAVGNAAFALIVVPEDGLVLDRHRAGSLSLGARIARHEDMDLVLQDGALREFLMAAHVRLAVIVDKLKLPSENAACRVDLIDGDLRALSLRNHGSGEVAGSIVYGTDLDGIVRRESTSPEQGRGGDTQSESRRGLDDIAPRDFHLCSLRVALLTRAVLGLGHNSRCFR